MKKFTKSLGIFTGILIGEIIVKTIFGQAHLIDRLRVLIQALQLFQ